MKRAQQNKDLTQRVNIEGKDENLADGDCF